MAREANVYLDRKSPWFQIKVVALTPNGSTYYYFSDNQQFAWDAAVRESNKIAPFCQE